MGKKVSTWLIFPPKFCFLKIVTQENKYYRYTVSLKKMFYLTALLIFHLMIHTEQSQPSAYLRKYYYFFLIWYK